MTAMALRGVHCAGPSEFAAALATIGRARGSRIGL
jgi:hypothetical protein